MKHFLIVTSIILLVSFPFFYSYIENAQDGSFNDYEYLKKMRRTHTDVNTDDKSKGWQDDGTFKSWYQQGTGSENDKALNNIKTTTPTIVIPKSNVSTSQTPGQPVKNETQSKDKSKDETKDENKTNLLPYLLLGLILILVIVIFYIKYKYY